MFCMTNIFRSRKPIRGKWDSSKPNIKRSFIPKSDDMMAPISSHELVAAGNIWHKFWVTSQAVIDRISYAPCPFCTETFQEVQLFESHLSDKHLYADMREIEMYQNQMPHTENKTTCPSIGIATVSPLFSQNMGRLATNPESNPDLVMTCAVNFLWTLLVNQYLESFSSNKSSTSNAEDSQETKETSEHPNGPDESPTPSMPSMMINMHHQNINKMDNRTENIPESTDIGKSLLCKHCKDGKKFFTEAELDQHMESHRPRTCSDHTCICNDESAEVISFSNPDDMPQNVRRKTEAEAILETVTCQNKTLNEFERQALSNARLQLKTCIETDLHNKALIWRKYYIFSL